MKNRYSYILQWYGKDPNNCEMIAFPIVTEQLIDIDTLNTFFDINRKMGFKVKRIHIRNMGGK